MTPDPHLPPTAGTARHWTVGDARIHRIDEILLPSETGPWLLPDATPELVSRTPWLVPEYASPAGELILAVHTFAVEIGGVRVLVDTGIGNGKTRTNPAWNDLDTPYVERLATAGFTPENVDLVLLTHLHTDHVGWNTRRAPDGTWIPTFPRARYLTSRAEDAYWSGVRLDAGRRQMFADSVQPVRDSGQLQLVDVPADGVEAAPGVRLLPAPGHTPGQVSVHLDSAGRCAVITGDCLHHPLQLAHPDICSSADVDPGQAARTRRTLLTRLADTDTLLLGSHFPPPTAGLVRSERDGFRLVPQERSGQKQPRGVRKSPPIR